MNSIIQTIRISVRALRANKMRSFLTMLGIIIGIAAVIVMVAVGSGAQKVITDQIASIGSNLLLVMPGSTTSGGIRMGAGGKQTLTLDDVKAIRTECAAVSLAAPTVRGSAQVVYGNMNWSTSIQGITPEMLAIRDWSVPIGRPLTQGDNDSAGKVCLIGATVADNLFGSEDPVGKSIRVKKVPFTVAGVLARKGQSPQGQDQDDVILMPLKTAQTKVLGAQFPNAVGAIMVQTATAEDLPRAEQQVNALLDQRHRTANGERDFTVRNLSEILAVSEQSSKVMSLLLGAVASISLLVGGIGIMNIMLVSVTERTREIGIRIAIGAQGHDILLQFLMESVFLTVLGGTIGIIGGVGGATIISKLLSWPTLVSMQAILVAFGFSAAVGIFFGFYPARKASNLNPIDALRYE